MLYFLHIPKTGGRTLYHYLSKQFPLNNQLHFHTWKELLNNNPQNFENVELITGHFGYGIYHILPKKPDYITFLRNPVDRTISFYHHMCCRRFENIFVPNNWEIPLNGLEGLLEDKEKKWLFSNNMSRHLAVDLNIPEITNNKQFLYESEPKFVKPDNYKDLLEIAKKNLLEFKFFGLLEKFDDSLKMLNQIMGWENTRIMKIGESQGKPKYIPNKILDKIKYNNEIDLELYDFAFKIFEERLFKMNHNQC